MDENGMNRNLMDTLLPPLPSIRSAYIEPQSPVINEMPKPETLQHPKPANDEVEPDAASSEVIDDPSFSYHGYQVVRGEYFAHINEPTITFSDYRLSVNTACLKKAPDVEFVQVLVNSREHKLLIRPSTEDVKDSFPWCTARRKTKYITCRMFMLMLVDLLRWDPDYKYKIIGKQIRSNGESLFVFDLSSTEIFQRQIVDDENGVKRRKTLRKPLYPDDWKNQFGLPVDEHKKALQVNIFDGYAVFSVTDPNKRETPDTSNEESKGE